MALPHGTVRIRGVGRTSAWAIVLILSGCGESVTDPETAPPLPSFLQACDVGSARPAFCGHLDVPEDHANPAGRSIALNIVVVPAPEEQRAPDPVVFLGGGPGAGVTQSAGGLLHLTYPDRDLVFVDQRGTGESNPLHCNDAAALQGVDLAAVFAEGFSDAVLMDCLATLQSLADLTQYTTTDHVRDLEVVLDTIGYRMINLHAGSYGTKVAQLYMKMAPSRIRTVVLVGVVPIEVDAPLGEPRGADEGVAAFIDFCEDNTGCRDALPDVRDKVAALDAELAAGPVTQRVLHPWTGDSVDVAVSTATWATALRSLSRDASRHALIPGIVEAALTGDWAGVADFGFGRNLLTTSTGLAIGMHFSVVCTEGVQALTEPAIAAATAGTRLGDFYVRAFQRICAFWPAGDRPADFSEPVVSDIPTLLISGGLDGVTPPSGGERVAAGLSRSLHLVSPFGGHGSGSVEGGAACFSGIERQFTSQASVEGLDVSCIAALNPPVFTSPSSLATSGWISDPR